jgi:hypothetical protein
MLEDRDQELRNMTYNTQHPIDIVFNAVEDYVDFAELGSQPLTPHQTIAKAYIILNKTRRFKNNIADWNRRTDADKTWINFKIYFRRAHQEFRKTTDVTLEESDLQQNNANLVQQVVDGLQGVIPTESTTDAFSEVRLQMANLATHTTESQQQLQAQIQQMQQTMGQLQAQLTHQQPPPQQYQPNPPTQFQQSQHQHQQYPPNQPYNAAGQHYNQFPARSGRNSHGYQGGYQGRSG